MDYGDPRPKGRDRWWGEYHKPIANSFPDQLTGPVCMKCHNEIKNGERLFALNFGIEREKKPMHEYLTFTGIYWHIDCVDLRSFPGMEERDLDLDEFYGRRPIGPTAKLVA